MQYEKVVVVMTVRFESFREMFKFLNEGRGQVYVEGEDDTDSVMAVTLKSDGTRMYFTSIVVMAVGILPDLSNVNEESLGSMFNLETFRGEITIDGSRM